MTSMTMPYLPLPPAHSSFPCVKFHIPGMSCTDVRSNRRKTLNSRVEYGVILFLREYFGDSIMFGDRDGDGHIEHVLEGEVDEQRGLEGGRGDKRS